MKKLFLSVAALLCATLMFSQNISDVKQTGDLQIAIVDQQGSNTAVVTQHYFNNLAEIIQDGDGYQPDLINYAEIYQDGVQNDARIIQGNGIAFLNEAYADQRGWWNTSRQLQLGDGNIGVVYQWGDLNRITQEQYAPLDEELSNFAYGDQWGLENEGFQTQFGKYNEAVLVQFSYFHYASQWQDGIGNGASIYQDGWRNHATQVQGGIGNFAWSNQNWLANYTDESLSGDNLPVQTQYGEYNEAYIAQDNFKYAFETVGGFELEDTHSIVAWVRILDCSGRSAAVAGHTVADLAVLSIQASSLHVRRTRSPSQPLHADDG